MFKIEHDLFNNPTLQELQIGYVVVHVELYQTPKARRAANSFPEKCLSDWLTVEMAVHVPFSSKVTSVRIWRDFGKSTPKIGAGDVKQQTACHHVGKET